MTPDRSPSAPSERVSRGVVPASLRFSLGVVVATLTIALGAQISIPMVPVPMTLQTLAVLGSGLVLGPRLGVSAAVLYAGLVVCGLPVLADGATAGGTAFLKLKSAGYVAGFVAGAGVAGWVYEQRPSVWGALLGGLLGHVAVLACGVPVLAGWIGMSAAIEYGLVPFLPGAVVKSALAAGIAWGARRASKTR